MSACLTVAGDGCTASVTPDPMVFASYPEAIAALQEWAGEEFSPVIGRVVSMTVTIALASGEAQ